MKTSLFDIAKLVNGTIVGDEKLIIEGLSAIDNIVPASIVFAEGRDNLQKAENSHAAAILVSNQVESSNKALIKVANPMLGFIQLLNYFHPSKKNNIGIHPTAVIADDVIIGQSVSIGAYVNIESGVNIGDNCVIKSHTYLGHGVTLGSSCTLHPQVTIYDNCQIGSNVIIHASTVIGSDGFGYTFNGTEHIKIPHVGHVIIEDNVEIGANSVVDCATIGATIIGKGTKIDNLVQIAHSVKLGQNNILCAFTGIAGSTKSGNHVVFAANVGVSDHVTIDDGVILAARAGVPPRKHLKKGNIYLGNPARPKDKALEQELGTTRIPSMRKKIKALSEKMDMLVSKLEQQESI
ncbi:MAG: UDP-3-O-(3-hydroxymyristoyl)glucosamine N-acyltransferase [Legionella sp.]